MGERDDGLVAQLLRDAAEGRPPPEDGAVVVVPQPPGPVAGILAFAAHNVIAADVDPDWVHATLASDDLGAPMAAPFVAALAIELGVEPDSLDIVLAAPGTGRGAPPALRPVPVDPTHARVARASSYRADVGTWATADDDAVLVVGRGLAGRWEAAYEVEPAARGRGLGRRLLSAALDLVPADEHLFIQIAPGNVSSLRVALAVERFRPIGAELLFPTGESPAARADPR